MKVKELIKKVQECDPELEVNTFSVVLGYVYQKCVSIISM